MADPNFIFLMFTKLKRTGRLKNQHHNPRCPSAVPPIRITFLTRLLF